MPGQYPGYFVFRLLFNNRRWLISSIQQAVSVPMKIWTFEGKRVLKGLERCLYMLFPCLCSDCGCSSSIYSTPLTADLWGQLSHVCPKITPVQDLIWLIHFLFYLNQNHLTPIFLKFCWCMKGKQFRIENMTVATAPAMISPWWSKLFSWYNTTYMLSLHRPSFVCRCFSQPVPPDHWLQPL